LTALTFFGVYGNALTGTLPDGIGLWTALTFFYIGDNALNGTIPPSIENCKTYKVDSKHVLGYLMAQEGYQQ
jgi:beta-glucanase (GH16 family)